MRTCLSLFLLIVVAAAPQATAHQPPAILEGIHEGDMMTLQWTLPPGAVPSTITVYSVDSTDHRPIAWLPGAQDSYTVPTPETETLYYVKYTVKGGEESLQSNVVGWYPHCWAFVTYSTDPLDARVNDHCLIP